jgi:hypothetical protein
MVWGGDREVPLEFETSPDIYGRGGIFQGPSIYSQGGVRLLVVVRIASLSSVLGSCG